MRTLYKLICVFLVITMSSAGMASMVDERIGMDAPRHGRDGPEPESQDTVDDPGTRSQPDNTPPEAVLSFDPALPGLGPVPAVETALERADLSMPEIGRLEIVEAFAAQVLACTDAWGLDPLAETPDIGATHVCPDGGAIALGHPWGASGALLVVRLFSSMVRADGPRLGVATCAVGGGQGVAMVWERVG